MMNPDGVYLGNTRGNLLGQDLNRHWTEPDPFAHPTVYAVRKVVHRLDTRTAPPAGGAGAGVGGGEDQQKEATDKAANEEEKEEEEKEEGEEELDLELDTVVDLHSHSSLMGLFVYGNSYDDVYRFALHVIYYAHA